WADATAAVAGPPAARFPLPVSRFPFPASFRPPASGPYTLPFPACPPSPQGEGRFPAFRSRLRSAPAWAPFPFTVYRFEVPVWLRAHLSRARLHSPFPVSRFQFPASVCPLCLAFLLEEGVGGGQPVAPSVLTPWASLGVRARHASP